MPDVRDLTCDGLNPMGVDDWLRARADRLAATQEPS
jgi:hypothetical protein